MSTRTAATASALNARLLAVVDRRGGDRATTLPVAATALCLLGAGPEQASTLLAGAARSPHPTKVVAGTLRELTAVFPYLRGHLGPLLARVDDADDKIVAGLLDVLADAPLEDIAEQVSGDLLGTLYMDGVAAPGDRSARGAFYTPRHVAQLMAGLVLPGAGSTFHEPCVGCGGLVLATIRDMRARGVPPETVRWVIGDLDRLALACAGVALAAHGMPQVVLLPGDAFSHPLPA